jgi:tyrosyl-tRNA synthetase
MSDEEVKKYIKQFTFLSKEQFEKLLKLTKLPENPSHLRILQRILTELLFFLLYQEEGLQ